MSFRLFPLSLSYPKANARVIYQSYFLERSNHPIYSLPILNDRGYTTSIKLRSLSGSSSLSASRSYLLQTKNHSLTRKLPNSLSYTTMLDQSNSIKIAVLCNADNKARANIPNPSHLNVELVLVENQKDDFEKKKEILRDCIGLVVVPPFNIDMVKEIWSQNDALKQIRWIHSFSTGVDYLNSFITEHLIDNDDVLLTNGKGAFSSSLAEYIMSCCLLYTKKIDLCRENKREKKWNKFVMPVLKGKTIGFVGYGDIAKEASRMAKVGFNMKVLIHRRNLKKTETEKEQNLVDEIISDKLELFRKSDFVVCTLPGTKETRHFCSSEEFEAMKDSAVFISCGRGVCVDEKGLLKVLNEKKIYAALDVFETEPLSTSSPLWDVEDERLLITAHNADFTEDYIDLGWNVFIQNLENFANENPFTFVVDKKAGY